MLLCAVAVAVAVSVMLSGCRVVVVACCGVGVVRLPCVAVVLFLEMACRGSLSRFVCLCVCLAIFFVEVVCCLGGLEWTVPNHNTWNRPFNQCLRMRCGSYLFDVFILN